MSSNNVNISFLYESELVSAEFNQRFADMLAGSILAGFRFEMSTTNSGYLNLTRGTDTSSVVITNKGARIEVTQDVTDTLRIESNATDIDRIDSIYVMYVHGNVTSTIDYAVIKGYPNGIPVPMMNKDIYTFLGYVKVPANGSPITSDCLKPISIGVRNLIASGTVTLNDDILVKGTAEFNSAVLAHNDATFEGTVNLKGKTILESYPTDDFDVATKAYVDAIKTGLAPKASVIAATVSSITLIGEQNIDGVGVVSGNRVLVKNQTNATENGLYEVQIGVWNRTIDADNNPGGTNSEVMSGMYCWVQQGSVNGGTAWILSTTDEINLGTTPLTFVQFSQTKIPLATEQTDGLMSSLDKRRADGFSYNQISSSNNWVIKHDLNKFPSVAIVDSAGSIVIGEISYTDLNTVTVKFSAPFSGNAYLN